MKMKLQRFHAVFAGAFALLLALCLLLPARAVDAASTADEAIAAITSIGILTPKITAGSAEDNLQFQIECDSNIEDVSLGLRFALESSTKKVTYYHFAVASGKMDYSIGVSETTVNGTYILDSVVVYDSNKKEIGSYGAGVCSAVKGQTFAVTGGTEPPKSYSLTLKGGTVDKTITAQEGSKVPVSIMLPSTMVFQGWTIPSDVEVVKGDAKTDTDITIVMPSRDITITANSAKASSEKDENGNGSSGENGGSSGDDNTGGSGENGGTGDGDGTGSSGENGGTETTPATHKLTVTYRDHRLEGTHAVGSQIELVAEEITGYTFEGWEVSPADLILDEGSSLDKSCTELKFKMPDSDVFVTGKYELDKEDEEENSSAEEEKKKQGDPKDDIASIQLSADSVTKGEPITCTITLNGTYDSFSIEACKFTHAQQSNNSFSFSMTNNGPVAEFKHEKDTSKLLPGKWELTSIVANGITYVPEGISFEIVSSTTSGDENGGNTSSGTDTNGDQNGGTGSQTSGSGNGNTGGNTTGGTQSNTNTNTETVPVQTAAAPGGSAAAAEAVLLNLPAKADDPKIGAQYGRLLARQASVKKNAITIRWKSAGARKYVIYGSRCGQKLQKLGETTKTKWTQSKLKKGAYYKFMVMAVASDGSIISTSKTLHIATAGGSVGNAKSVSVKGKTTVTLKKGKKVTLKATAVPASSKQKMKRHRALCFESSDESVATVSSKGVVKAMQKGKCSIFIYAQNGVYKKVTIKVK